MFRFRRWWSLFGAVLVGVVALNGVVDAKAGPARGVVCVRVGTKALDGVSGRGLVCVQTKVRGLRWLFEPTTVTTTKTSPSTSATTTVASANVAPRVVSAVSATGNAVITIADMSPDTGVYAVQWVPVGQSFNSFSMFRTTTKTMNVPYLSCTRTYTLRVFVMQADWQLSDGFVNQNVTPHSVTFDLTMPACTATAATVAATTTVALTCATGGTCIVGNTGPGGGIVFYVSADPFTSTGSDCNTAGAGGVTTCKYLEAAPNGWGANTTVDDTCTTAGTETDPVCTWSGNGTLIGVTAQGLEVGRGYGNTQAAVGQAGGGNMAGRAITAAWDYANNTKSDWHLPSRDELNELCKYARNTGQAAGAGITCTGGDLRTGFVGNTYWSSSEANGESVWVLPFGGLLTNNGKSWGGMVVRPVRAFG